MRRRHKRGGDVIVLCEIGLVLCCIGSCTGEKKRRNDGMMVMPSWDESTVVR